MEESMYDSFYKLEDKHWWFQARKEIVLKLIDKYFKKRSDSRIFDIGCGTGKMLNQLSRYGKVWGIDDDIKAVKYSQNKAPSATIILGSFPEAAPDENFDLVTVFDVIEHIDNDLGALKKIKSILRPGGVLILTVPAYNFLWDNHDNMNYHKRRYIAKELKEKIHKAGLRPLKISYYNSFLFFPVVVFKITKKIFSKSKRSSDLGKNLPPIFLNIILKAIFSSEKYFLPFFSFPFGVSIIAVAEKSVN